MLYRLGFGCILVVFWSQYNVVTMFLESTFLRCYNVNLQRCHNQKTMLSTLYFLLGGNVPSSQPGSKCCVSQDLMICNYLFIFTTDKATELNYNRNIGDCITVQNLF